MSYAFRKVGQPGMVLKDKQLMAIRHVHNEKDVFVCLPDMASCYMVLPFVFVPRIHFERQKQHITVPDLPS